MSSKLKTKASWRAKVGCNLFPEPGGEVAPVFVPYSGAVFYQLSLCNPGRAILGAFSGTVLRHHSGAALEQFWKYSKKTLTFLESFSKVIIIRTRLQNESCQVAHQRGDRRVAPPLTQRGMLQESFRKAFLKTFLRFSCSIPQAVLLLSCSFPETWRCSESPLCALLILILIRS